MQNKVMPTAMLGITANTATRRLFHIATSNPLLHRFIKIRCLARKDRAKNRSDKHIAGWGSHLPGVDRHLPGLDLPPFLFSGMKPSLNPRLLVIQPLLTRYAGSRRSASLPVATRFAPFGPFPGAIEPQPGSDGAARLSSPKSSPYRTVPGLSTRASHRPLRRADFSVSVFEIK
jgi:hypothetical protein